jgi:hypothetical protein
MSLRGDIGIKVDGLYIRLCGPFPRALIEVADKQMYFSDRRILIQWLNAQFPEWRTRIIYSENL